MGFDLDPPDTGMLDRIERPEELFLILADIMKRLRSDRGCLWDREQDHSSLKKSLIEEAYETVEAIDSGDPSELKEELGDLLLQVVFHGQIAEEEGSFTHADIIRGIIKKLLRRHPHVFSSTSASSSREILRIPYSAASPARFPGCIMLMRSRTGHRAWDLTGIRLKMSMKR